MVAKTAKKKDAPTGYQTIEEIAAEVNKSMGKEILIVGSSALTEIPRLSTGILSFDLSFGGGWASNQWNELVGVESSGKTAIAFRTIAAGQQADPNFIALFVAAEEFVPSYAKSFGVDLDRLWLVESNEMELVFETIVKAAANRVVDLIVLDSLPALITEAEAGKNLKDGIIVSPGAKIISTFFKKSSAAMRRSLTDPNDRPVTGIMINQWRDQIGVMFGDPRITPGGKAKNYHLFLRVEANRDEWIQTVKSDLTTRVGQTIAIRTFKNKTYRPQQRAQVDFYFADTPGFSKGSFDTVKDLVNVALALDLFEGRYKFEGERIANKKEDLYAAVRQDIGLQEKLWEASQRATLPHLFDNAQVVE